MTRITPALKGLITSVLMIAVVIWVYYNRKTADPRLQYAIFVVYIIGILWTLISYRRSPEFTGKFADVFSQGFRCFIVVTLVMVVFVFIFQKMNPEIAQESADALRKGLLKEKSTAITDIEKQVADYKKQFALQLVYISVFQYLLIGAAVTAAGAALSMRRTS